jgi:hypothetical protein
MQSIWAGLLIFLFFSILSAEDQYCKGRKVETVWRQTMSTVAWISVSQEPCGPQDGKPLRGGALLEVFRSKGIVDSCQQEEALLFASWLMWAALLCHVLSSSVGSSESQSNEPPDLGWKIPKPCAKINLFLFIS